MFGIGGWELILIFAVIVFAVLHFYHYTKFFRKLQKIKHESSIKLLVLEFAIFLIIMVSAYIYQDPLINILPNPFNVIVFLIILAVPVYLYIEEKFLK